MPSSEDAIALRRQAGRHAPLKESTLQEASSPNLKVISYQNLVYFGEVREIFLFTARRHEKMGSGCTLVKLLVVIVLIGVLIGLLLPAVQSFGVRIQCANKLKQMDSGALNLESWKNFTNGWRGICVGR